MLPGKHPRNVPRNVPISTLSPVTSHSAALLNLYMPFRVCCSARQRPQHNRLHVRRRGRTQRCE
eukprot:5879902-Prymnesium_polylepis.1